MSTDKIESALRKIVELLVAKDYGGLEALSNGVRLTASEIEAGVADYGRTLVAPPADAYAQADVIALAGSVPRSYSVRFQLFTPEEGRSDLEVQATLVDHEHAEMAVEIDNIIVA